jgi:hypothetical protein
MKKLILILSILGLHGCALYDAYFMAKFDVNEYQYITRLRTHAEIGLQVCDKPEQAKNEANYIWVVATEYKNYAEMIPHNENSFELATTLAKITDEFHQRYQGDKPVSTVYCKAKFTAIEKSSENIQKVLGAKPR